MILDISDAAFKRIMNDQRLFLPKRWKGVDFAAELRDHYSYYIKSIEKNTDPDEQNSETFNITKSVCGLLEKTVEAYLKGFPDEAYNHFRGLMDNYLIKHPLKVYNKSITELFNGSYDNSGDRLYLYRVVRVPDNSPHPRKRVFHTPYNMRSKVSSSRYSIAGYPSLYLATSLRLCCQELHFDPYQDFGIASLFQLDRHMEYSGVNINVVELAIKPQDFICDSNYEEDHYRRIPEAMLRDHEVREAYMLWYPLIAACSYIRTDRTAPFAAEYIIPQLLMQWVRRYDSAAGKNIQRLTGIRYFSCVSVKASDLGFNYVFPTSGKPISNELPFCSVLKKAFRLTEPVYLNDYHHRKYEGCERYLKSLATKGGLDHIDAT